MKKQISALMLAAAFFTTNSLIAMDKEEDTAAKIPVKTTATHMETSSETSLLILNNDVIPLVLQLLPIKDLLSTAVTSKRMNELYKTKELSLLQSFCPNLSINFNSVEEGKEKIKKYFALFKDTNNEYEVDFEMLGFFICNPIHKEARRSLFLFSIGGQEFILDNWCYPLDQSSLDFLAQQHKSKPFNIRFTPQTFTNGNKKGHVISAWLQYDANHKLIDGGIGTCSSPRAEEVYLGVYKKTVDIDEATMKELSHTYRAIKDSGNDATDEELVKYILEQVIKYTEWDALSPDTKSDIIKKLRARE